MKTRIALIALGIMASAGAVFGAGPQLVFETSNESDRQCVAIADISRLTFVEDGLDLTGVTAHHFPYSQLLRITIDHEGSIPDAIDEVTDTSVAIRVTPSPAVDFITIEGLEQGAQVRIFSTAGAAVASIDSYNGTSIDVSSLPGGIYIVKTKTSTAKFVKY